MSGGIRIRGLTLWRPWPYAVARLGKDIENRTWVPPLREGDYLAIHAGKKWDEDGADFLQDMGHDVGGDADHPAGVIVAVARYAGYTRTKDSRWWFGPVGWRLADVVAIGPIPCKGAQGLWPIPEDVLALLRVAWLAKRKAA